MRWIGNDCITRLLIGLLFRKLHGHVVMSLELIPNRSIKSGATRKMSTISKSSQQMDLLIGRRVLLLRHSSLALLLCLDYF